MIIVGAGGFAREEYYLIKSINEVAPRWNIKGFLSDVPMDLASKKIDLPILGTIKDWHPGTNEVFAMGISSPAGKAKVADLLESRGAQFETLISPKALVSSTAIFGTGSVVTATSSVGDCVQIGRFVHIAGSMIGQDSIVDDYSTTTGFTNVAAAKIGKRVFIGSHAVILNRRKVGDDAFVCAGSIVCHNIKPGCKVFGNPAKKVDFDFA